MARHDEHKLRQFIAARRKGDEGAARRWWDELAKDNFDRVRAMVRLQARGRLSDDEQDEAVQLALIKIFNNMIHTFRGTSMGEWVECTRTLVFGACVDTQRRAVVRTKHERSLERAGRDEDDASRYDSEVYAEIEQGRREQEDLEAEAEALLERQAFVSWAVPQLPPKLREVIELDCQNVEGEEIQRRLGVSRDVVYQRRSRGIRALAKLREQHES